jgi:hypothetical protein
MKLQLLLSVLASLALPMSANAGDIFSDDVGVSLPSEFIKYKATKTGGKVTLAAWIIYHLDSGDLKAKADATLKFYLSADSTLDESELLLTKSVKNIKAYRPIPKSVKAKFNLTEADKGKSIYATIESPQDQYFDNNVVYTQILADSF